MFQSRRVVSLCLLFLILSLAGRISPAQAVVFQGKVSITFACNTGTRSFPALTVSLNDILVVVVYNDGNPTTPTVSDTQTNSFTLQSSAIGATGSSSTVRLFAARATATGSDTISVAFATGCWGSSAANYSNSKLGTNTATETNSAASCCAATSTTTTTLAGVPGAQFVVGGIMVNCPLCTSAPAWSFTGSSGQTFEDTVQGLGLTADNEFMALQDKGALSGSSFTLNTAISGSPSQSFTMTWASVTLELVSVTAMTISMTDPNPSTVPPGRTSTSTITVTSVDQFTGTVSFSTAVNTGLTQTFNPTSVTLSAGATATTTLSIFVNSGTLLGTYTISVTATSTGAPSATTSFSSFIVIGTGSPPSLSGPPTIGPTGGGGFGTWAPLNTTAVAQTLVQPVGVSLTLPVTASIFLIGLIMTAGFFAGPRRRREPRLVL